jgi:membrane-associated phospholipid phosphatase
MSQTEIPWRRFLLVSLVALIAAHLLDRWAYHALHFPGWEGSDAGEMLRAVGYGPTWLFACFAFWTYDRIHRRPGSLPPLRRAALVFGAVAAGGLAAEVLKLTLRRMRPETDAGLYVFRPWTDEPFSSGGLALPSSHAIVAFSGAAILARLLPGTAPVWYLAAAGCAFTRVADQDHFVSDVVLSAVVAWLVVALIWRRFGGPVRTAMASREEAATPADS